MTNRHYLPSPAQPDFPGLLTDTQAQTLSRVQAGLQQIHKAIQRVNGLIVDGKLRLRTIGAHDVGMVYGETERMAFMHELAEQQLRRAWNAPERMAA
ncbi:MAG TPA: hypothetical protein VFQ94_04185 [Gallionella sp.]|nr:hypothetical protein [Gallionella sp.]